MRQSPNQAKYNSAIRNRLVLEPFFKSFLSIYNHKRNKESLCQIVYILEYKQHRSIGIPLMQHLKSIPIEVFYNDVNDKSHDNCNILPSLHLPTLLPDIESGGLLSDKNHQDSCCHPQHCRQNPILSFIFPASLLSIIIDMNNVTTGDTFYEPLTPSPGTINLNKFEFATPFSEKCS